MRVIGSNLTEKAIVQQIWEDGEEQAQQIADGKASCSRQKEQNVQMVEIRYQSSKFETQQGNPCSWKAMGVGGAEVREEMGEGEDPREFWQLLWIK